jgi:hypothetical protein
MFRFIKENKKAIIISLTVGIFIFYLQPLLNAISSQIVNLLISVSNKYSNIYYQLMAKNDPNLINTYMALIILILFCIMNLNMSIKPWAQAKDLEDKLKKLEQKIKGGEANTQQTEINMEIEIAAMKEKLRKNKVILKLATMLNIFIFLFFAFNYGMYSQINRENVTFRNQLTVLSVHVVDNDIKKLKAEWVQMKSVDDYNRIHKTMTDYYKKYNLNE